MIKSFNSSNGLIQGDIVINAFIKVANAMEKRAYAVRNGAEYASHVTAEQKDEYLVDALNRVEKVREGECNSFAIWQMVNMELTGDCIALLA